MAEEKIKLVCNNKKAYHEYFIEDKYEAGIELFGTEVKSIRAGKCSLNEAFVVITAGEAQLCGMNVSPYEHGNIFNREPLRVRRLLLHKKEIRKLEQEVKEQGYSIVPLQVYFKKGRVKVEIGLGRGKKLYDKRETAAKRDQQRQVEKEYKLRLK
ncbi:SsrA-binding protein SmpB [Butyrivibrio sp. MC2013]|uniref:SsrA-binding protein SmpB n=1 Tax=Butyrivibrio sp. MC2013 TaxID=1280686 RepID=UPI00041E2714|nr:SsrA-binding protein SmpB [Butyrivibrio sp. MC2013]